MDTARLPTNCPRLPMKKMRLPISFLGENTASVSQKRKRASHFRTTTGEDGRAATGHGATTRRYVEYYFPDEKPKAALAKQ